jgi:hypothetical protein
MESESIYILRDLKQWSRKFGSAVPVGFDAPAAE